MDWKEMLLKLALSEQALLLYAAIILFVYRKLQIKQGWDTERWEGLVTAAFLAAEKSNVFGEGKLAFAMKHFSQGFKDTYGKEPSVMDLKDAAIDFAKKAYELKFTKAE